MAEQGKLVLGFIGNGKSTNRYHLPFILTRQDKIKVKNIKNKYSILQIKLIMRKFINLNINLMIE